MSTKKFLWIAFLLSAILRATAVFLAPPTDPGKYEQLAIAKNYVEGRGFGLAWPYPPSDSNRVAELTAQKLPYPSAFMPPFVPALATVVMYVARDMGLTISILLVIQTILASFIPLLVYAAGKRLGSEKAARISTVVSLFFAPGLFLSATPAGAVFYAIAGLLIMIAFHDVVVQKRNSLWLGLGLGFLVLLRAEALMLSAMLCALVFVLGRNKLAFKQASIAFATMIVIVAPWSIRNTLEIGKVIPVVSHPWREVWRGFNPIATGSGYAANGWQIWEGDMFPHVVKRLDSIPITRQYEVDADNVFKKEVVQFVSENPGQSAWLVLRKFFMLWTYDPYYPNASNVVMASTMVLCSLLILLGLHVLTWNNARSKARLVAPYTLFAVFYTLVVASTYVMPRYQAYIFTVLLPVSGYAVQYLLSKLPSPRGSS